MASRSENAAHCRMAAEKKKIRSVPVCRYYINNARWKRGRGKGSFFCLLLAVLRCWKISGGDWREVELGLDLGPATRRESSRGCKISENI